MSYPLMQLRRCKLFQQISSSVWNQIIGAHAVNEDEMETGITRGILVKIKHYNRNYSPNFDIYAKSGWNEKIYGSDLDVFVETARDEYRWLALQVKILKKNLTYTTFRDTSDNIMQWEKLNLLEGASGCKSYYLLLNGVRDFAIKGVDKCHHDFDADQYGCSLVEPSVVERLASIQENNRYVNPTFSDFHPNHAQPWRIIPCCNNYNDADVLYSLKQITESDPNFVAYDPETSISSTTEQRTVSEPDNPIAIASTSSGWNPGLRMVIKRRDSI
jgi:hypothetical protein